jgi:CNP1-like family
MTTDHISIGFILRRFACALLLFAGTGAFAQLVPQDPDWQELDIPPPSFSKDGLIAVDMPAYVTLKFGIDPATLSVSSDLIVRYVMVAVSPTGAVNAMFEGLRCNRSEFKTYARWSASGKWLVVKEAQWRPLDDNNTSHHALALARQGACEGRTAAASSAGEIIRKLKSRPTQF